MKDNLTILKESGKFYLGYNITEDYKGSGMSVKVERGLDAHFEENCSCDKVYLSFEWFERIYNEMKELRDKEK